MFKEESKTANKFFELVQDFYQARKIHKTSEAKAKGIRLIAEAERDSDITKAETRVKVAEIEYQAFERIKKRELRRQKNINNIIDQTPKFLSKTLPSDSVDEDWLFQFFDHCQDISDKDMQILWSRLLAGEVNKPGGFSLRTLGLVKTLNKEDAKLFTSLCTFGWTSKTNGPILLVPGRSLDEKNKYISRAGLYFAAFQHLETIGFIRVSELVLCQL